MNYTHWTWLNCNNTSKFFLMKFCKNSTEFMKKNCKNKGIWTHYLLCNLEAEMLAQHHEDTGNKEHSNWSQSMLQWFIRFKRILHRMHLGRPNLTLFWTREGVLPFPEQKNTDLTILRRTQATTPHRSDHHILLSGGFGLEGIVAENFLRVSDAGKPSWVSKTNQYGPVPGPALGPQNL